MIKHIKYSVIIILGFLSNFVIAQEKALNSIPHESVHLIINSNIFLAGEALYYNFFCLNNTTTLPSNVSKIGYVELIGENENILFKHKLQLDNGTGYGDYFIPSTVNTGQYKLVAYTKWTDNSTSNAIFIDNIYIVNPYITNQINEENGLINIVIDESKAKEYKYIANGIKIELSSNTVNTRSLVSLDLKNSVGDLYNGNYSLSVRKVSPVEIQGNMDDRVKLNQKSSYHFLPEIRGEIISGTVQSKTSDSLANNMIVALSIPGENYVFKNVLTDKFGRFYFNLNENFNTSDVLIQVFDEHKNKYKIVLDNDSFIDYKSLEFKKVKLDQTLENWLTERSINNQIENAYYNTKADSILVKSPPSLFYSKPTFEYKLDDYKRFPTLKETFIEVIQEGAIRNDDEDFKFKIYDVGNERYGYYTDYNSLVLLDGVLIQDKQDIINYDTKNIESINLVRGTYFYGPSIFHGIIDIKTKEGDFKLSGNGNDKQLFNLVAPINSKMYYSPNYDEKSSDLKRIPDYRNQLLWLPNFQLNSDLKTINFYSSDVKGVFEIVLEGFTFEGKQIISKQYFEVKN
jgi:hypothetical protein